MHLLKVNHHAADLLPLSLDTEENKIYVRPQHETTNLLTATVGALRLLCPICSTVMHDWAMQLLAGRNVGLIGVDPMHFPDQLFAPPTRPSLMRPTPQDVKFPLRPSNQDALQP